MIEKLIGTAEEFALEVRILMAVLLFSLSNVVLGTLASMFTANIVSIFFSLVAFGAYGYSYYLCRIKHAFEAGFFIYMALNLVGLSGLWLFSEGMDGITPYYFAILLLLIFFNSKNAIAYVVAIFACVLMLILLDDWVASLTSFRFPMPAFAREIVFLSSLAFISILSYLFKTLTNTRLDSTFVRVMKDVQTESNRVDEHAESLTSSGKTLLDSTVEQATAIEQLGVVAEELNATAQQNNSHALEVSVAIKNAQAYIESSKEDLQNLVDSIGNIHQSSESIQAINNMVSEIAYQTNLLSLNAMIEASRADENSGGFKVVAHEVKRLAERSTDAVAQINTLLENNFVFVDEGSKYTKTMQSRFNEIGEKIEDLQSAAQNVSNASVEQRDSVGQIVEALGNIDKAIEHNKLLSGDTFDRAQKLSENAKQLSLVVDELGEMLS